LDGYAFHSSRARWQRDRQRQNDLVDAGWTVLRFTTDDLRTRPTSAVALVARALLGAASRTS
jgi:very-short-patch-repair endonuclease